MFILTFILLIGSVFRIAQSAVRCAVYKNRVGQRVGDIIFHILMIVYLVFTFENFNV